MHGRRSLNRSLQKVRRAGRKRRGPPKNFIEIGNWRLEEDTEGDLVATNRETQRKIVLLKK